MGWLEALLVAPTAGVYCSLRTIYAASGTTGDVGGGADGG